MTENTPPTLDPFEGWRDWRVMLQRFNPASDGPQFVFVTVHAADAEQAGIAGLASLHKDDNVALVQVVESNGFVTGYDELTIRANMTQDQREVYELRTHYDAEFQAARVILKELRAADAAAAESEANDA